MLVAFAESMLARCIAGSPARQRGNFLLRGQKKVTKEKALNRTPAPHARAAPCNSHSASGQTRPASLSLLSLSPASLIATAGRLTRGCTPCSRVEKPMQRRSGGATLAQHPPRRRPSDAVFAGEPGVQPALSGLKGRCVALVLRTAVRAKRVASGRIPLRAMRARRPARVRIALSAPLLVTFLWRDREKLPARRGGLPAPHSPPSRRYLDAR